jgi:hypothetical protein
MGVNTLLTTDKPAVSYRLSEEKKKELAQFGHTEFNGLGFVRSHYRLENLAAEGISGTRLERLLDITLERYGFLVLFTHEVDTRIPAVLEIAENCFAYLRRRGIPSL